MAYSVQVPERVRIKVAESGYPGEVTSQFWGKLFRILHHKPMHELGRPIVAPVRVWVLNVVVPCSTVDKLVSFTVWVDYLREEQTRRVYDVVITSDDGYESEQF